MATVYPPGQSSLRASFSRGKNEGEETAHTAMNSESADVQILGAKYSFRFAEIDTLPVRHFPAVIGFSLYKQNDSPNRSV